MKELSRSNTEIERKFLVRPSWKPMDEGAEIRQGYLCREKERTVRVRTKGRKAYLTVKGATEGITRREFEYEIPPEDAEEMLALCEPPLVEKVRHHDQVGDFLWEIDVFHGANEGLVLAEVELPSEDAPFQKPVWAAEEVSGDPRYYNANLIAHPYCEWKDEKDCE